MGFWVYFTEDKKEYYDSDACELYLLPDKVIKIVANSKLIFDNLILNHNHVISRTQIIEWIDSPDEIEKTNKKHADRTVSNRYADRGPVDQAIAELRRKLEKYRSCIKTVHRVGYKYDGPFLTDKNNRTTEPLGSKTITAVSSPVSAAATIDEKVAILPWKTRINKDVATKLESALIQFLQALNVNSIYKLFAIDGVGLVNLDF